MHPSPAHLRRTIVETIARLRAIEGVLPAAVDALRDAQPGFPTSSGGGGSTPTLDAAGNPPGLDRHLVSPDPALDALRRLDQSSTELLRSATLIYDIVTRWGAPPARPDETTMARSGSDCRCCERFVSGSPNDRLRAGLCQACYRDWLRSHSEWGGDRGEWMLARRRALRSCDTDDAVA